MTVTMRSWDLVWGLGYDIPSFVAVQMIMARQLDTKVGEYTHNAGSAHVYEQHWGLETWPVYEPLNIDYLLADSHMVADTREKARNLLGWYL